MQELASLSKRPADLTVLFEDPIHKSKVNSDAQRDTRSVLGLLKAKGSAAAQ